jgi:hypothetical protein
MRKRATIPTEQQPRQTSLAILARQRQLVVAAIRFVWSTGCAMEVGW